MLKTLWCFKTGTLSWCLSYIGCKGLGQSCSCVLLWEGITSSFLSQEQTGGSLCSGSTLKHQSRLKGGDSGE